MGNDWLEISPESIEDNPFRLVGTDWMLVTAGNMDSWNTMTASWGGLGVLWGKKVCFCFVRPSRHTYGFMEESEQFTLSFFSSEHRAALDFCGAHSGRDVDKAKETGLIPRPVEAAVGFEQARLTILCRKIYHNDIESARFVDPSIEKHYNGKDYHRQYIGEILSCFSG